MKRTNSSKAAKKVTFQFELDETIMDKKAFLSQKKEVFSLKEIISLLPSYLARDELIDLHKKLSDQISERTSIICEMIPDDIWKRVFQITAHKNDISKVFPLKQVSKRWERNFLSAFDEVRIKKSESLKQIYSLKSIRSLILKTNVKITDEILTNVFLNLNRLKLPYQKIKSIVSPELLRQMTNLTALDITSYKLSTKENNFININNLTSFVNLKFLKLGYLPPNTYESLKKLVNLKEIDASSCTYTRNDLVSRFGPNMSIIDHLPNLKMLCICRNLENDFININELQKRYLHVQFRWLLNVFGDGYYEGSFSEDNKMSGKGKISYSKSGNVYEGEFKNDMKEGKGAFVFHDGRYEGEYKNDMMDGKGIFTYSDGNSYEGEFKNDNFNGQGVYTWSDGRRHIGQFKDDNCEGKGVVYWPDGNRFEGEFKNDLCNFGVRYYSDGSRYEGEVNGYDCRMMREGKGIMFYSNDNRYEGQLMKVNL